MKRGTWNSDELPFNGKTPNHLATVGDLMELRLLIAEDLSKFLQSQHQQSKKRWVKSHEIRRILRISPGTLQTLKKKGVIAFTKLGGVHYFDLEQVTKLLENGTLNLD